MVSLGEGSVDWVFEVGENGSDLAYGWERKIGTPFIGLWVGEEERKGENCACVNPNACVYPLRFALLNLHKNDACMGRMRAFESLHSSLTGRCI